MEWNLADILFSLLCVCLCVCALSPIGLNGQNDILFAEKCIWLVCEKLTLFPYGQDIDGNFVSLAFWWYRQIQEWSGGFREMDKNVTVISRKMDLPQHAMQRWHHGIGQQRIIHSSIPALQSDCCSKPMSVTVCVHSAQYATKGSFILHYCVANSLGGYMHSLRTF